MLLRTGIAGKGDDIDQRLLKILLIRRGVPYPLAQGLPRNVCVKLHSQCQLHSSGYHRPIQENVVPHGSRTIRHQLIRDLIHPGIVPALIGKPGYFPEHTAAGIIDITVYASHLGTSGPLLILNDYRKEKRHASVQPPGQAHAAKHPRSNAELPSVIRQGKHRLPGKSPLPPHPAVLRRGIHLSLPHGITQALRQSLPSRDGR